MTEIEKIQNIILELFDCQDELTRSDLQGAIEAQVELAYRAGRESVIAQLREEQDPHVWSHL